MAHRGTEGAYGDLAERRAKMDSKYDKALEAEHIEWIKKTCGEEITGDFQEALKNGMILCKLLNALEPGSVRDIYKGTMAFKQMENINQFLKHMPAYGVRSADLFQTPDLFEGTNMASVQVCIQNVRRISDLKGKGVKVPTQSVAGSTLMPSGKVGGEARAVRKLEDNPVKQFNKYDGGAVNSTGGSKGQLYGDLAERKAKLDSKYNKGLEKSLQSWIESKTGEKIGEDFQEGLKSGVILCKLMEKLKPGCGCKFNTSKMAFKQMENISNFLAAAQAAGIRSDDCFQTVDLYEGSNMTQVLTTLDGLHRICT